MIIGIAGGTGSGKTTFTKRLKAYFKDDITIIFHDDYYKCHDHLTYEERCLLNYDHPDALDTQQLIGHLKQLKQNQTIEMPIYDFSIHNRKKETQTIYPNKVIIVEGILTLENQELSDLFDLKIYVEADADERLLRRILRDVQERNRDIDDVCSQYLKTVKPMHNKYVEPTKHMADIIIVGGLNDAAFDLVKTKIETFIGGSR